jgi:hypothetical protein
MMAESTRKNALRNWRLRLQTSGIYRAYAIPELQNKSSGSAAFAATRPWSGPGVSAQVASLQSLTLCSGQHQSREQEIRQQVCNCRRR